MYFLSLIVVGTFWILGRPDRRYTVHWLTRYLIVALWYILFCLAACISFNSWLFSRSLFSDFSTFSDPCKKNALLLFATVQAELVALVLVFSVMNKHFCEFYYHINMYIDLLFVLSPLAALVFSNLVSLLKESFLTQLQDLQCRGDISSFVFISNIYWSNLMMKLGFGIPKLLTLLYLAVSGTFHRRYRFMSKLDKGLFIYFVLFFFETLFYLHTQMLQRNTNFSIWDITDWRITCQPIQLLLVLPIAIVPYIIYKITEPIVLF